MYLIPVGLLVKFYRAGLFWLPTEVNAQFVENNVVEPSPGRVFVS